MEMAWARVPNVTSMVSVISVIFKEDQFYLVCDSLAPFVLLVNVSYHICQGFCCIFLRIVLSVHSI